MSEWIPLNLPYGPVYDVDAPQPHKWYAQAKVENGIVVSVK